jgi:RNA polymerase sigma-70 factor (ECF subfamily)
MASNPNSPAAKQALEELCRRYWQPIHAYIRRRLNNDGNAEDLTQDFFAHLLENNGLAGMDKSKGRFRSFLLVSVKNFLNNERDRANALKRGGGRKIVSLDEVPALEHWCLAESPALSPDAVFAKRWALEVIGKALARLKAEEEACGRGRIFQLLHPFLTLVGQVGSYETAAVELGLNREAVATAVSRLRKRYNRALRAEIGTTVSSARDIDEEMKYLAEAFRPA